MSDFTFQTRPKKLRRQTLTKAEARQRVDEKGLNHFRLLDISDFAILVLDNLERWFRKYPDGFDKHSIDCADQRLLDGECWETELGFSKGRFKKYFAEFGKIYSSPEAAAEAESLFDGKRYCSILDFSNNCRTKYLKNPDINNSLDLGVVE